MKAVTASDTDHSRQRGTWKATERCEKINSLNAKLTQLGVGNYWVFLGVLHTGADRWYPQVAQPEALLQLPGMNFGWSWLVLVGDSP